MGCPRTLHASRSFVTSEVRVFISQLPNPFELAEAGFTAKVLRPPTKDITLLTIRDYPSISRLGQIIYR